MHDKVSFPSMSLCVTGVSLHAMYKECEFVAYTRRFKCKKEKKQKKKVR